VLFRDANSSPEEQVEFMLQLTDDNAPIDERNQA
jgi:hypothetical protein